MGIQALILIATMTAASTAVAFPVIANPLGAKDANCQQRRSFNANAAHFSDLVHKIAVSENDTRVGMSEFTPQDGFEELAISPAEKAEIAKNFGKCYCHKLKANGKPGKRVAQTDCSVAGDGQTMVTTFHLLEQQLDAGGIPRGSVACEMQNAAGDPPERLVFKRAPPTFRFGTSSGEQDPHNDRATVKLARKIPGAGGLRLSPSGQLPLQKGTKLLMVSTTQLRMSKPVAKGDLIAQTCTANTVYAPDEQSPGVFYTDCSSTAAASGSAIFARDYDGKLTFVGIVQGSSGEDKDGQPFYLKDAAGNIVMDANGKATYNNVTRALAVNGDFLNEVLALNNLKGPQMAGGELSRPVIPAALTSF